ncbi:hypothetical protein BDV27DRAFT_119573 [Aspergillus caelatus]|uniref:Uncharacterized protein n=1 Tax=Aspergillus caelatus TaxID=61420 RepID=A0A5N7ALH9_9EURO|nr:uncharacterized protein BDV27DRAFT_119573 [Aspergillus caelatus]KAE8370563.1 hypothetical protein BDV27DRAFT_119573 [Aspergillus caelatus]
MDMLHHIYRLMLGGDLYKAPIPQSSQCILDIGSKVVYFFSKAQKEFKETKRQTLCLHALHLRTEA